MSRQTSKLRPGRFPVGPPKSRKSLSAKKSKKSVEPSEYSPEPREGLNISPEKLSLRIPKQNTFPKQNPFPKQKTSDYSKPGVITQIPWHQTFSNDLSNVSAPKQNPFPKQKTPDYSKPGAAQPGYVPWHASVGGQKKRKNKKTRKMR